MLEDNQINFDSDTESESKHDRYSPASKESLFKVPVKLNDTDVELDIKQVYNFVNNPSRRKQTEEGAKVKHKVSFLPHAFKIIHDVLPCDTIQPFTKQRALEAQTKHFKNNSEGTYEKLDQIEQREVDELFSEDEDPYEDLDIIGQWEVDELFSEHKVGRVESEELEDDALDAEIDSALEELEDDALDAELDSALEELESANDIQEINSALEDIDSHLPEDIQDYYSASYTTMPPKKKRKTSNEGNTDYLCESEDEVENKSKETKEPKFEYHPQPGPEELFGKVIKYVPPVFRNFLAKAISQRNEQMKREIKSKNPDPEIIKAIDEEFNAYLESWIKSNLSGFLDESDISDADDDD